MQPPNHWVNVANSRSLSRLRKTGFESGGVESRPVHQAIRDPAHAECYDDAMLMSFQTSAFNEREHRIASASVASTFPP